MGRSIHAWGTDLWSVDSIGMESMDGWMVAGWAGVAQVPLIHMINKIAPLGMAHRQ